MLRPSRLRRPNPCTVSPWRAACCVPTAAAARSARQCKRTLVLSKGGRAVRCGCGKCGWRHQRRRSMRPHRAAPALRCAAHKPPARATNPQLRFNRSLPPNNPAYDSHLARDRRRGADTARRVAAAEPRACPQPAAGIGNARLSSVLWASPTGPARAPWGLPGARRGRPGPDPRPTRRSTSLAHR